MLPPPKGRGCIFGTILSKETIPSRLAHVDVQSFHANRLVLRGRSNASGTFHMCIKPHARERQLWQKSQINLRIEFHHPGYMPQTLDRTWSPDEPLKLRIFLEPVSGTKAHAQ
ncbi:MAG: hypothetical protein H6715_03030 [Myxococcales bacterium]|nr:hypothetical protein [Myxococcales bacterium]